jgi:hypothetical protein
MLSLAMKYQNSDSYQSIKAILTRVIEVNAFLYN